MVLTLDHDYDEVCRKGRNRYTQELQADLAVALRVPQGRIEVLELARGSVKATIALYDSGSGPAPLALVRELQRQLAEPGSALKQGRVSSMALAIQSLSLPGLMAGSSRASEIGENFVEELAQNIMEPGPPPSAAPEVTQPRSRGSVLRQRKGSAATT